ncbi:hypothetical protein cypCar_00005275 [Cyprinus carpio]|nr:hypothetical protein cypCar_00005275 [Cyprinus carpio]
MKGVQSWSLLHTWTFTQSVMSLQDIPDSPGLLCVTLGHLEITEARVVNTLLLASAKQNIRTLAAVEGEKDALIGWTECKTLLIW